MNKIVQIILIANGQNFIISVYNGDEIIIPRIGEKLDIGSIISEDLKKSLNNQKFYVIDILHKFESSLQTSKVYISNDSRNYNDFYCGLKCN